MFPIEKHVLFEINVSLLGKIVKSLPDCTKCFQCLSRSPSLRIKAAQMWQLDKTNDFTAKLLTLLS